MLINNEYYKIINIEYFLFFKLYCRFLYIVNKLNYNNFVCVGGFIIIKIMFFFSNSIKFNIYQFIIIIII